MGIEDDHLDVRHREVPMTRTVGPILCAILIGACTGADDPPYDRDHTFALIDRFDTQRTVDLPFVRVATGQWIRDDNGNPKTQHRFGFLQNGGGSTFTICYLDLRREMLTATPASTPEHERVVHERWDIAQYAREVGKDLTEPDDGGTRYYMSPSTPMDPRGEALILARACARRGLENEVEELFDAVGSVEEARNELADGLLVHLDMDSADLACTPETGPS